MIYPQIKLRKEKSLGRTSFYLLLSDGWATESHISVCGLTLTFCCFYTFYTESDITTDWIQGRNRGDSSKLTFLWGDAQSSIRPLTMIASAFDSSDIAKEPDKVPHAQTNCLGVPKSPNVKTKKNNEVVVCRKEYSERQEKRQGAGWKEGRERREKERQE